jgi:serine/threonine-protein kinase
LNGETLGHYRIDAALGQGAMGAVYRAFDTRLQRAVAVKVLKSSDFSSRDERRRLLREARAVAPLTHPAIATVYEVVDLDDVSFIVMELVEGDTLRAKVGQMAGQPLALARLGLSAVRALRAAHEEGIVHGDIKPENLMISTDGALKILDFGVSRRLGEPDRSAVETLADTLDGGVEAARVAADEALVSPGSVAGTLLYMPPEQMRGEAVDGRADLYSLGVVLQELATGRLPFEAESAVAVMAQALSNRSAMVETLRQSCPPELARVLGKMLSTSAADRHASAQEAEVEFEMAIAALEGGGSRDAETRRVVVVLPFELLAGSADDDFLRIALAQAVTHGLAEKAVLEVRPTSAVTRYLETASDVGEVAAELSADVVLEGTIQRLGAGLRVQVQAWDARAHTTLLSLKRDATMDQLFDLQDRLAEDIALKLAPEGREAVLTRAPPVGPGSRDAEAYELYLRAGERLLRATDYDTRTGIEQLERSVRLDPDFAEAWARLAASQLLMAVLFAPQPHWYQAAETSVARALALDPGNPEAWSAQGRLLWSPREGYRNEDALRYLGAACRHQAPPHDAQTWHAVVLAHVGLHDEAEYWIGRLLKAQPDDILGRLLRGEVRSWAGDFEAAAEQYAQLVTVDPGNIFARLWNPIGLIYVDDLTGAEASLERARDSLGNDAVFLATRALLEARRGDVERAREAIAASVDCSKSVSHQHHATHHAAAAAAWIGDTDRAVELLRRSADTGFPNYPAFRSDPHFERVQSEPAFVEFMDDVERRWRGIRSGFGAESS